MTQVMAYYQIQVTSAFWTVAAYGKLMKTNSTASHSNSISFLASDFKNSNFFTKGSGKFVCPSGLDTRDK